MVDLGREGLEGRVRKLKLSLFLWNMAAIFELELNTGTDIQYISAEISWKDLTGKDTFLND